MKFRIPFTKKIIEVRGLQNPPTWMREFFGGGQVAKSGVDVTANTALQVSTVFACVRVISETVASLPLFLYKTSEGGKQKALSHDLYNQIYVMPNSETTAYEFWQMFIVNLLLTGDGFAYIIRNGNGQISELWNIPSSRVTIYRNENTKELYYKIRTDKDDVILYPENVMHVRGMKFDNLDESIDPMKIARDALGLAIAQEEYGSKYFANGAIVGGIVEHPAALSDNAFNRFKNSFNDSYRGVGNSNKILFLEEGSKFTKISNTPDESQAIESRQFQVLEICRYFGVPPHKIFDLSRATFSNIEQQSIEFVQNAILPLTVKIEQSIYKDLLLPNERRRYFAKFNLNGLLRGDTTARKDFYVAMLQNGVMNPNEVRQLEDMNKYDGGDKYLVNGNVLDIEDVGEGGEDDADREEINNIRNDG